jgi:two-component system sensor histidine kinase KdpD
VAELLAAGVDVITTVGIGHLDSLADIAEKITGVPAGTTVPDPVVRAADEIELIDVTPEALRDRIARGQVYPREHAEAALFGAFRVGPLAALRELALPWLAASLTQNRQRLRPDGHVDDGRPTRERVMVALTGGPEGQALIRRAARIAARSGGDLPAVHVTRPDGPAAGIALAGRRQLTESIGGTYHQLADLDIPDALLTLARTENATQLVLGRRNRSRLGALRPRTRIRSRVIRGSSETDVHIITYPASLTAWPAASVRY